MTVTRAQIALPAVPDTSGIGQYLVCGVVPYEAGTAVTDVVSGTTTTTPAAFTAAIDNGVTSTQTNTSAARFDVKTNLGFNTATDSLVLHLDSFVGRQIGQSYSQQVLEIWDYAGTNIGLDGAGGYGGTYKAWGRIKYNNSFSATTLSSLGAFPYDTRKNVVLHYDPSTRIVDVYVDGTKVISGAAMAAGDVTKNNVTINMGTTLDRMYTYSVFKKTGSFTATELDALVNDPYSAYQLAGGGGGTAVDADVAFAASGTSTAAALADYAGAAGFSASGTLTASAGGPVSASTGLAGSSTLSAEAVVDRASSMALSGAATLKASGFDEGTLTSAVYSFSATGQPDGNLPAPWVASETRAYRAELISGVITRSTGFVGADKIVTGKLARGQVVLTANNGGGGFESYLALFEDSSAMVGVTVGCDIYRGTTNKVALYLTLGGSYIDRKEYPLSTTAPNQTTLTVDFDGTAYRATYSDGVNPTHQLMLDGAPGYAIDAMGIAISSAGAVTDYQHQFTLDTSGVVDASVALSGSGSLALSAAKTAVGALGLAVAGALAAAPVVDKDVAWAQSAVTQFTADQVTTVDRSLAVGGTSAFTAVPALDTPASVAWQGSSSAAFTWSSTWSATLGVAGSGTGTFAAGVTRSTSLGLASHGDLTATAIIASASSSSATLAGTSSLALQPVIDRQGTVSLASLASLGANAVTATAQGVALSAEGTFQALPTKVTTGQATLSSTSQLTVANTATFSAAFAGQATSALTAEPVTSAAADGQLSVGGQVTLALTAAVTRDTATALSGAGQLNASAAGEYVSAWQWAGNAQVALLPAVTRDSSLAASASAAFTAEPLVTVLSDAAVQLSAQSTLAASPAVTRDIAVGLASETAFVPSAAADRQGAVALAAQLSVALDTLGGTPVHPAYLYVLDVAINPAITCYTVVKPVYVAAVATQPANEGTVTTEPAYVAEVETEPAIGAEVTIKPVR